MSDDTNEPGRSADVSDLFDLADLYDALPEVADAADPFDSEASLARLHTWIDSNPQRAADAPGDDVVVVYVTHDLGVVKGNAIGTLELDHRTEMAIAWLAAAQTKFAADIRLPELAMRKERVLGQAKEVPREREVELAKIELETAQAGFHHAEQLEAMKNQQQLELQALETERKLAELDLERSRLELEHRQRRARWSPRISWGMPAALLAVVGIGFQVAATHDVAAALYVPSIVVGTYMLMLVVSTVAALFSASVGRAERADRVLRLLLWRLDREHDDPSSRPVMTTSTTKGSARRRRR